MRRRRQRAGIWWAVVALAILAMVGIGVSVRTLSPPELDEATLCPKDTGPHAGLFILLDLTDPLGRTERSRLRDLLEQAVADAVPYTLIAVAAVAADPAARGVSFSLCKPLEGEDANELYQNPRLIARRYEEKFKKPFDDMIDGMFEGEGAPRSPIMESLQAGLAETPGFLDAAWPRRIVIASDLLQHSDSFSFYRGDDWRSFEGSTAFGRMAKTLDGVDVEILRLPRAVPGIDPAAVDDFWVRYFDSSGAESLRVQPIGDL